LFVTSTSDRISTHGSYSFSETGIITVQQTSLKLKTCLLEIQSSIKIRKKYYTTENNKNKPRKQAAAHFRLNTGHDCLAAHLHRIKIFSHNYCTICKLKNTTMDKHHLLVCPKLDRTSKELSKLYLDARRLME
jgi:hypothetical protein